MTLKHIKMYIKYIENTSKHSFRFRPKTSKLHINTHKYTIKTKNNNKNNDAKKVSENQKYQKVDYYRYKCQKQRIRYPPTVPCAGKGV